MNDFERGKKPWGRAEGGRFQHCRSHDQQSLPWTGSLCLAHLLQPAHNYISTYPPILSVTFLSPWRVPSDRKTVHGCRHTLSLVSLPSERCSPRLEIKSKWKSIFLHIFYFIPRISLAFAQRILTSLSLITSHFLNCSICWSRSLVSPILVS